MNPFSEPTDWLIGLSLVGAALKQINNKYQLPSQLRSWFIYFILFWVWEGGSSLRSPAASPPSPRSPSPSARHLGAESERTRSRSDRSWKHFIMRYYGGSVPPRSGGGGAINIVKHEPSALSMQSRPVLFLEGGGEVVLRTFFFLLRCLKFFRGTTSDSSSTAIGIWAIVRAGIRCRDLAPLKKKKRKNRKMKIWQQARRERLSRRGEPVSCQQGRYISLTERRIYDSRLRVVESVVADRKSHCRLNRLPPLLLNRKQHKHCPLIKLVKLRRQTNLCKTSQCEFVARLRGFDWSNVAADAAAYTFLCT